MIYPGPLGDFALVLFYSNLVTPAWKSGCEKSLNLNLSFPDAIATIIAVRLCAPKIPRQRNSRCFLCVLYTVQREFDFFLRAYVF